MDAFLVTKILDKVLSVFGTQQVKVRFRSSSNTEDDLMFNGAGLYDSTSVCIQDNLDGDGDRAFDLRFQRKKRGKTIERGLKKVWLSIWNPKAFDERTYYQIDHLQTRMGVLVSQAYPTEDSNGVAFTGDPVTGSKDYFVINVQKRRCQCCTA